MIIVVLCGGSGKRMNEYSFPKPLNMIYGKPAIYYTLMKLPEHIDKLHFIVAPHLIAYNFAEIVTNLFPLKQCIFHNLPYNTRGAVESAWLGTKDIYNEHVSEPVVFLDNDNMYDFPSGFFDVSDTAFLGYSIDHSDTEAFSFIKLSEHSDVIEYKEKQRISDIYCCGVYGFKNLKQFREIASIVLANDSEYSTYHCNYEIYMSSLYQYMLKNHIKIKGVHFQSNRHLGSLKELLQVDQNVFKRKLRICFDLDNTLVTYPMTPGDYSSVKPVKTMIDLVKTLKADGHTIIIHTARRMRTHDNNVAAVIADIGQITFQTLADFEIPYDELLFGKPYADMYIDDKAVNPYRDNVQLMGLVDYCENKYPINKLNNNKYNIIIIENGYVKKTGPNQYLQGEIYYYKNITSVMTDNSVSNVITFFPKYIDSFANNDDTSSLCIEYILGIPFYTLYKNQLLSKNHLLKLFDMIVTLHKATLKVKPTLTIDSVASNYINKLNQRFRYTDDYPFDDAKIIQDHCLSCIETYCNQIKELQIAPFIHGDLWFSNIILEFSSDIKFLDMKGIVDGKLTTAGDIYYDYGKLYQSFLGYDAVLYGDNICEEYRKKMLETFETWATSQYINLQLLKLVTFALVMGTFHFIKDDDAKHRVWHWIKRTFMD